ncbi:Beta-galactosidase 10 [Linum grandiflorum]
MKTPVLCFFCLLPVLLVTAVLCSANDDEVSYDSRSLIIHGRRHLIISASIHYPRSDPQMWPELVRTAKEGGANAIETYVFWNGHEISPDVYNFAGRFDLVKFVKTVQEAEMFLILRIGPFVAAEWNYGGIPVWLHYIPGTVFRTDNTNFKFYMEKFMTYIVNLMKQEKLFASQGDNGPIILAQVENEYQYYEQFYGVGKRYAYWAANMAVSQHTGVPWIMCQEPDAPDPVIDTCNSFYCDSFQPTSPNKPKIWTENWTGWFQSYGQPIPHRPPQDIAFSVARFFQKGGSVVNYYMYHGGTNFGRTGGAGITTSYDYDAPIDEYGLPRFPKWGHLKELHGAIRMCENVLLSTKPVNINLGPSQEADVYADASSGDCVAFLANTDNETDATVVFKNVSYHLPPWSVSILPDCKNVVFNTAKMSYQSTVVEMIPEDLQPSPEMCEEEEAESKDRNSSPLKWQVFEEKAGIWGDEADLVKRELVDHINTTKDGTDYLWYTTSIVVDENEEFLGKDSKPVLVIQSKGHYLHAFVNGKLQGSASGYELRIPISLRKGRNDISLLNTVVGLPSGGVFYEWIGAGPTSVKLEGFFNNGTVIDLSTSSWSYKIGLEGEKDTIYKTETTRNEKWIVPSEVPKMQPLTWYKVTVDEPSGNDPIGIDMVDMGKGFAWLNGQEIGRYWLETSSKSDKCVAGFHGGLECDYRGTFFQEKCRTGCGDPTQRWYHIPRSWFKPCGNILVMFEEEGGDPTKINFSKRRISSVSAQS